MKQGLVAIINKHATKSAGGNKVKNDMAHFNPYLWLTAETEGISE